MSEPTQEHERIFLAPLEEADPFEGRQWCQDDGNLESPGIEFIRNDIAEKARAAAYRAGRLAQAEEDAALIKANTIQHSSNGDHLKPRYDGDRAGLAYSAAIRANADRLRAEGEGEPK